MNVASRGVTFRDFAIFQLKLAVDGMKDVIVFNVSIIAMLVDLVAGRENGPGSSTRFSGSASVSTLG